MPESGATLGDYLKTLWQYPLPQHALSRLVHRLTRVRQPALKNRMIRSFTRHFDVDLHEAVQTDAAAYATFNEFFTRALRAGTRPIAAESDAVVSPVDGHISQIGYLKGNVILQAKGRGFTVDELLGDAASAEHFTGGAFATLYLSPRDYHRVHMPADGSLTHMRHIPGRLFSVNPPAVRSVPRLFARNERVACLFDTRAGVAALVLVGALNVGSIETAWAGEITPPHGKRIRDWSYPPATVTLQKGAEAGRFNMGSTVILLFSKARVRWAPEFAIGAAVRIGQRLGTLRSNPEP